MRSRNLRALSIIPFVSALLLGCGSPPAGNTAGSAVNTVSRNTNIAVNSMNSASTGSAIEAREPEQYQATVRLTLESIGDAQKASLPAIGANVARSGADRLMEFTLPTGEKIVYLEKGNANYVILPGRKQYAELSREELGFEVRKLLMPAQIVNQVRAMPGVKLAGEENMNGRQVLRYTYSATADTQTQAGSVAADSYLLVDKETGLPLRSETVAQSTSGGTVQGMKGLLIVTEMSDLKATADPALFALPTDFAKIDSEQIKAQANLVFSTIGALIGQVINQAQPASSPAATASPVSK